MKKVSLMSVGSVALTASFALTACGTSSSGSPMGRGEGGASAAGAGAPSTGAVAGTSIITEPGNGTGGAVTGSPGQFASCAKGNA